MMQPARRHTFTDSQASVLLDLLRGLASLLVLATHWRNIFFVDYHTLPASHRILLPFYLLTTNGHRAVVLFFVMSGYFISNSIFRMISRRQWSWARYSVHRLVRLWIVLLPGLLLTLFWDHLGIALHQAPLLYTGGVFNHVIPNVTPLHGWRILAANAVFLQGIVAPVYGSNTPLWSLANEFWYYVLFPLAWIALRVSQPLWRRALLVALFALVLWFIGSGIRLAFPIWLLGVVLVWLPAAPDLRWLRIAAGLLLAAALYGLPGHGVLGSDGAFALVTTLCLWVILGAGAPAEANRFSRFSRAISRFSFTLYIAHMPLLVFLASLTAHDSRWLPSPRNAPIALGVLAVVLGYAWLLAGLTEFRTDKVRAAVEKRFGMRNDAPSAHEKALST